MGGGELRTFPKSLYLPGTFPWLCNLPRRHKGNCSMQAVINAALVWTGGCKCCSPSRKSWQKVMKHSLLMVVPSPPPHHTSPWQNHTLWCLSDEDFLLKTHKVGVGGKGRKAAHQPCGCEGGGACPTGPTYPGPELAPGSHRCRKQQSLQLFPSLPN